MKELHADVVIIGGGLGGCAATQALLALGKTVIMSEPTAWIGGQITAQAVPPDEHPWIEQFGCTRRYRALREGVRQHYRDNYPLTALARANRRLNPGNGFVSTLCHEPKVSLAVLEASLRPFESGGQLQILRGFRPDSAEVTGDKIRSVTLVGNATRLVAHGSYFIDASELGDLLPLSGTEFV